MTIIRWTVFILTGLTTTFLGIAFGEEWMAVPQSTTLGICLFLGLFPVGWFLGKGGKTTQRALALTLPMLLLFSGLGGSLDLQIAYRDCERISDQLRADLIQYHNQKGKFPQSLDQLGWTRLPGGRLLGNSILHYDFGIKSYRMYFSPHVRTELWNSCSFPRKK